MNLQTQTAAPATTDRRWTALVVIAIAQLMVALDATVVNIALPTAQQALDFSDADRAWVVTAYTSALAGLLILGGRIADRVGRRRAFLVGLVGFAASSALAGAAPSLGVLITGRALQGAFAAVLAPTALSLIAVTFTDGRERAKAFGVYGAVASSGAAVGLLLGGVLAEYAGWRWCLYVNVAIALVAFVIGQRVLPPGDGYAETPDRRALRTARLGEPGGDRLRLRAGGHRRLALRRRAPADGRRPRRHRPLPGPPAPEQPATAPAVGAGRRLAARRLPLRRRSGGGLVRDVPDADLPLPGGPRLEPGAQRGRVPAALAWRSRPGRSGSARG